MQCACAILSSVIWPALQYFSTLSHTRHVVRKSYWKWNVFFFIFSAIFVRSISHYKKNRARYDQKCTLYSLFLSVFNETWIFVTDFQKTMKYSYNENPARVGTVVPFGRTDMTKLIVAFYKHVNVPKELSVNTTYGNNNFYYLIHIYIYINTHTYVYIYIYILLVGAECRICLF